MSGIIGTSHSKSKIIGRSQDTAKAWICFAGNGTPSITDSYNVSSITDNGTGQYGLNFETALSNATYAVAGCHDSPSGYGASFCTDHWNANTTTQCAITTFNSTAYVDPPEVFAIIFGD